MPEPSQNSTIIPTWYQNTLLRVTGRKQTSEAVSIVLKPATIRCALQHGTKSVSEQVDIGATQIIRKTASFQNSKCDSSLVKIIQIVSIALTAGLTFSFMARRSVHRCSSPTEQCGKAVGSIYTASNLGGFSKESVLKKLSTSISYLLRSNTRKVNGFSNKHEDLTQLFI